MKEGKGNTVLLIVIGIATLLIAVVGATFAFFTAQLSGQETGTTVTVSSGTIGTSFEGGAVINVGDIYPRTEVWLEKKFNITTTLTDAAVLNYTLKFVITSNTFSSGALKYTFAVVSGETTENTGDVIATAVSTQTNINTGNDFEITLGSGKFQGPTGGAATHTYKISIFFPDTGSNQNAEQGKALMAYVDVTSS